nr:uncharacterized protein LOC127343117 isoform X2 [Lolium perenne]
MSVRRPVAGTQHEGARLGAAASARRRGVWHRDPQGHRPRPGARGRPRVHRAPEFSGYLTLKFALHRESPPIGPSRGLTALTSPSPPPSDMADMSGDSKEYHEIVIKTVASEDD